MKKYIPILIFLNVTFHISMGQNIETFKIALLKQSKSELKNLSSEQLERYESKILQLLTQQGIASVNAKNTLILHPKLIINDEQVINPGVQTLHIINAELVLIMKQPDGKAIFETITKKINGSGKNSNMAINNLISNIDINDDGYCKFLTKSKQKALQYYNENCLDIISEATQLNSLNRMEEALILLVSIPRETVCYKSVLALSNEIFIKYQKQNCEKNIQNALLSFSNNNYEDGFRLLTDIDPLSPCSEDVKKIIKNQSKEVDNQQDVSKYWNYLNYIYSSNVELQKYRTDAIERMSLLYALRNPFHGY